MDPNEIATPLGIFTISTNETEELSITESTNLSNIVPNLDEIILTCPYGTVRKYNKNSSIFIIEDFIKNPPCLPHRTPMHIYDFVNKELKFFYCTSITNTDDWCNSIYNGILIDVDGNAHYCFIPSYVYKQIPASFKSENVNNNHFKFDNFGTLKITVNSANI